MKWQAKARMQGAIAALPRPLSGVLYRQLQLLGGLRNPLRRRQEPKLRRVLALADVIRAHGRLEDAAVLEIGTGSSINMAVVMWLLGARRIVAVDLERNLHPALVSFQIGWYRSHRPFLVESLPRRGESVKRLDALLALPAKPSKDLFESAMALCNITYLAPADAGNLDMPDASFDLHVSNSTLEHVPPEDLHRLLRGARRLLRPGGLCAHHIDNADHFFGCDSRISRINFLRFDDAEWNRYADNRFAYVNRLRSSEYPPIFSDSGFDILDVRTEVDDECVKQIESGALPLAERFRNMAVQDLATTSTTIVATPSGESR